MGLKGLSRPFRARVSVWVPLTQAVGLGFVRSPLRGSPAHTPPLWRGKTEYARRRVKGESDALGFVLRKG
jgi:hypothetical protein